MSDMYDPNDMPDDPDHTIPDHVKAQADTLLERWGNFADDCRQMGLYIEGEPQIIVAPHPSGLDRAVLTVQYQIGKVAFSDRVLNPEDAKFDTEFRTMEVAAKDDAFLDERARIREAMEAGKTLDEILLGDDNDLD